MIKNNLASSQQNIINRLDTMIPLMRNLNRIPSIESMIENIYNEMCDSAIKNYYPEGEIDGMDIGDYTNLQIDSIKSHFTFITDFSDSGKRTLLSFFQGEPTSISFVINNTPEKFNLNGHSITISNAWFSNYKTYVDTISSIFFIIAYLIWLWGQLPNILKGYVSLTNMRNDVLEHNERVDFEEANAAYYGSTGRFMR